MLEEGGAELHGRLFEQRAGGEIGHAGESGIRGEGVLQVVEGVVVAVQVEAAEARDMRQEEAAYRVLVELLAGDLLVGGEEQEQLARVASRCADDGALLATIDASLAALEQEGGGAYAGEVGLSEQALDEGRFEGAAHWCGFARRGGLDLIAALDGQTGGCPGEHAAGHGGGLREAHRLDLAHRARRAAAGAAHEHDRLAAIPVGGRLGDVVEAHGLHAGDVPLGDLVALANVDEVEVTVLVGGRLG